MHLLMGGDKLANLEGMKDKFLVVKRRDLYNFLNSDHQKTLTYLLEEVASSRRATGKKENTYLVINTDEPYADEVIEIMKRNGHWG